MMFEELTQYTGNLNGTNVYRQFWDALFGMAEKHPEYDLLHYYDILALNGLPLDGTHRPEEADISNWNAQGVLGLLVAIFRQDRLNDGLIRSQLENGTIDRCLERLKELDQ